VSWLLAEKQYVLIIASTEALLTSTKFKTHYEQLHAANSSSSKMLTMPPVKWQKTEGLLCEADSNDSDDEHAQAFKWPMDGWIWTVHEY